MPERPISNPKQFVSGAPVLQVQSRHETARCYEDKLGLHGIMVTMPVALYIERTQPPTSYTRKRNLLALKCSSGYRL
jgi:hypothetical protein